MIVWNSRDPAMKPRIQAEAARRGIAVRDLLDEMAGEYFEKAAFLAPFRDATEARTANREIADELRGARQQPA
jgi:hypothetical protein